MSSAKWTDSEKRIARRAFHAALQHELAEVMTEFKRRAATAKEPEDMWSVEQFLATARRDIDSKYDYRYSQLDLVFGRLLREGRIGEGNLQGLSEDKLAYIRRAASL
jgi:Photoprotection regulator fluorescence recovery protein